jgi:hypothetical protein
MDRTTIAFIVLLIVLFIGGIFVKEGFVDASGNDISGNDISGNDIESIYKSMRDFFMKEVKDTLRETLEKNAPKKSSTSINSNNSELKDSCMDSIVKDQGKEWLKYIPGKNPDDYIRKDSIPCWGCSL